MAEAAGHRADSVEAVLLRRWLSAGLRRVAMPGHILPVERGLFDKLADTDTSQGDHGHSQKTCIFPSADFIRKGAAEENFVVLDRLQDPGNIGTIIRTADAAGYGSGDGHEGNGRRVLA